MPRCERLWRQAARSVAAARGHRVQQTRPAIGRIRVSKPIVRDRIHSEIGLDVGEPLLGFHHRAAGVDRVDVGPVRIAELHRGIRSRTCGGIAGVVDARRSVIAVGVVLRVADADVVAFGIADLVHAPDAHG